MDKHGQFLDRHNSLRRDLIAAIIAQFDFAKSDEGDIQFDEYIDIKVCSEVDREIDVRATGMGEINQNGMQREVFVVIEAAEKDEPIPIEEVSTDTLMEIHKKLEDGPPEPK